MIKESAFSCLWRTHRDVVGILAEIGDYQIRNGGFLPLRTETISLCHGQLLEFVFLELDLLIDESWVVEVLADVGDVADGLKLEESGNVVQGSENQDGQDVEPCLDVVPETEKRSAHRNVPKSWHDYFVWTQDIIKNVLTFQLWVPRCCNKIQIGKFVPEEWRRAPGRWKRCLCSIGSFPASRRRRWIRRGK